MTILLIPFFIGAAFAHNELHSMQCGGDKITIKRMNMGYEVVAKDRGKTYQFSKPTMADFFNPDLKQLFDTYTFKEADFEVVVHRPETKGQVTDTIASYKGEKLPCTNLKGTSMVGIKGLEKFKPKDAPQSPDPKK